MSELEQRDRALQAVLLSNRAHARLQLASAVAQAGDSGNGTSASAAAAAAVSAEGRARTRLLRGAVEDAEAAVTADKGYTKAHFRLGVATVALVRGDRSLGFEVMLEPV